MNLSRTSHATAQSPVTRSTTARARLRGAAGAGLLAALALTGLSAAGPAYADDASPAPRAGHTASEEPSARPAEPGTPESRTPSPVHPRTGHAVPSAQPATPGDRTRPTAAPAPGDHTRATPAPAPAVGRTGDADKKQLAHTGASDGTTLALGGGAAALLAIGGGTVYAARRRRA